MSYIAGGNTLVKNILIYVTLNREVKKTYSKIQAAVKSQGRFTLGYELVRENSRQLFQVILPILSNVYAALYSHASKYFSALWCLIIRIDIKFTIKWLGWFFFFFFDRL